MKLYSCLVLEDTFSDQLAIEMTLSSFPEIQATYVSSAKAFLQQLPENKYSLFIIDIMLGESLTGIDLIQSITDPAAWVIISSSLDSKEYYEQYKALKFNKFFIKKPLDEFIFKTNIESFLFTKRAGQSAEIIPENEAYFMLKQGNYLYKVAYSEITFIETTDHATTIYTYTNKYTTYTSLKAFEDLLKSADFEKVNRNTLVNMNAVKRINTKENYLEIDSHRIPISRSNKQLIIEKYLEKAL